MCPFKSFLNEFFAANLIKRRRTIKLILLVADGLIDHIPCKNPSFISSNHTVDMGLDASE